MRRPGDPIRRDQVYEQERLLLWVQEALAEAITRAGVKRCDVATYLRVSPPYITKILSDGTNLTLRRVADVAFAAGFRVVPKLESIAAASSSGRRRK